MRNGRTLMDARRAEFAAAMATMDRLTGATPAELDALRVQAESVQATHDDATDPRVNPCPECPEGEVELVIPLGGGLTAYACSVDCGWSA